MCIIIYTEQHYCDLHKNNFSTSSSQSWQHPIFSQRHTKQVTNTDLFVTAKWRYYLTKHKRKRPVIQKSHILKETISAATTTRHLHSLLIKAKLHQTYTTNAKALQTMREVTLLSETQRAKHLKLTSILMKDSRLSEDWDQKGPEWENKKSWGRDYTTSG